MIPVNTNAKILLPSDDLAKVTLTGLPKPASKSDYKMVLESGAEKRVALTVGSGEYTFEISD